MQILQNKENERNALALSGSEKLPAPALIKYLIKFPETQSDFFYSKRSCFLLMFRELLKFSLSLISLL